LIGQLQSPAGGHDTQLTAIGIDDPDFSCPDFLINGEFLIANIRSPPVYLAAGSTGFVT
jgi:hypothetical protein